MLWTDNRVLAWANYLWYHWRSRSPARKTEFRWQAIDPDEWWSRE
jgi:hypothetical protein